MLKFFIICLALVVSYSGWAIAAPECRNGDTKPPSPIEAKHLYHWSRRSPSYTALACRIPTPKGFKRIAAKKDSYTFWLRHLPLLPPQTPVRSYRGETILHADSRHLLAVVDLDVGKRDRQQCADTIMRLRGEYLFQQGRAQQVRFRWAGGKRFSYRQWQKGLRPVKEGRRWSFKLKARPSAGYRSFRRYMEFMFSWTGTLHQMGEQRVKADQIRPGDFFIQGGSPGHAVVVLDLARGNRGRMKALLGQGFMPAQDLHLLRTLDGRAWFTLDPEKLVSTPLWRPFRWSDLRRFSF